jgi:hypothetical protein
MCTDKRNKESQTQQPITTTSSKHREACSVVTGVREQTTSATYSTVALVASNTPRRINCRRLTVGSTCTTPTTSTPLRLRPNALMTSCLKCHGLYTGCGLDHPDAKEVRHTFCADEGRVGFVRFVPYDTCSPASKSLLAGLLYQPPRRHQISGTRPIDCSSAQALRTSTQST